MKCVIKILCILLLVQPLVLSAQTAEDLNVVRGYKTDSLLTYYRDKIVFQYKIPDGSDRSFLIDLPRNLLMYHIIGSKIFIFNYPKESAIIMQFEPDETAAMKNPELQDLFICYSFVSKSHIRYLNAHQSKTIYKNPFLIKISNFHYKKSGRFTAAANSLRIL